MRILIREAKKGDVDQFYQLANDQLVRKNSFNTDSIPYEEHCRWFNNKISASNVLMLVAYSEICELLGQVRFENEEESNCSIVSISISESIRGKGMTSEILAKCIKDYSKCYSLPIHAYIKFNNLPSVKLFEKLGFKLIESFKESDNYFGLWVLK